MYVVCFWIPSSTPTSRPLSSKVDPAAGVFDNGDHRLFFRPVICELPGAQAGSGGPPPSSVTAADIDCSNPDASSVPKSAPGTESASKPATRPAFSESARYVLGPADFDTRAISAARAVPFNSGQSWAVEVTFTAAGNQEFNLIASQRYRYYEQNAANPPLASLEAFQVNGVVIGAPAVEASQFNGIAEFSGTRATPYSKPQADQIVQAIQYDITHQ